MVTIKRIIKKSMAQDTVNLKFFKCNACKCIFEVTIDDCNWVCPINSTTTVFISLCPSCGKVCYKEEIKEQTMREKELEINELKKRNKEKETI